MREPWMDGWMDGRLFLLNSYLCCRPTEFPKALKRQERNEIARCLFFCLFFFLFLRGTSANDATKQALNAPINRPSPTSKELNKNGFNRYRNNPRKQQQSLSLYFDVVLIFRFLICCVCAVGWAKVRFTVSWLVPLVSRNPITTKKKGGRVVKMNHQGNEKKKRKENEIYSLWSSVDSLEIQSKRRATFYLDLFSWSNLFVHTHKLH